MTTEKPMTIREYITRLQGIENQDLPVVTLSDYDEFGSGVAFGLPGGLVANIYVKQDLHGLARGEHLVLLLGPKDVLARLGALDSDASAEAN